MTTVARDWFFANWQYAGLVAALILLALVPVLAGFWSLAFLVIYLHLPVYMVHQVEEHAGNRFQRFVNSRIGHGRDVLTTGVIVATNVGGVWILFLVSLYLARFVDLGLGLIPVYVTLVNAVVHILGAAKPRAYNPGLVTSVVLFLPLGIWALTVIGPHATLVDHLIALVIAVAGHGALIAIILGRTRSRKTPEFVAGKN